MGSGFRTLAGAIFGAGIAAGLFAGLLIGQWMARAPLTTRMDLIVTPAGSRTTVLRIPEDYICDEEKLGTYAIGITGTTSPSYVMRCGPKDWVEAQ